MDAIRDILSEVSTTQEGQFERLYELLISANERINLTSITAREDVFIKHFADSVAAACHIKQGSSVLDIGTGGGFPALPLAIARPDLVITALDSVRKKVDFVASCAAELGLRVNAVHARIEDFKMKNSFDYVLCRAVAPLRTLAEYALPFLRLGGTFIAYKSQTAAAEIVEAKTALFTLGGEVMSCPSFILAGENMRTLIIIKKLRTTPPIYPRGGNKPRVKPI